MASSSCLYGSWGNSSPISLPVQFFVFGDDLFQIVRVQIGILLDALAMFGAIKDGIPLFRFDAHHNAPKHLDKAAIGVIRKPFVARLAQ